MAHDKKNMLRQLRYLDFQLSKAITKLLQKVSDKNGKLIPVEDDETQEALVRVFKQLMCSKLIIGTVDSESVDK